MNSNIFSGKWKELKGEIQNQWGKLTSDELESTKGNMKAISGLIEKHYGEAKDEVADKLNSLMERFGRKAEGISEDVKESLREKDEDYDA